MVGDILKINNYNPPLADNILFRPRISERLDTYLTTKKGFARQLTLLSAPAGFGKTTVVRAWIKGKEANTAWLSLDEEDNDPERFWTYLLSALQNLYNDLQARDLLICCSPAALYLTLPARLTRS